MMLQSMFLYVGTAWVIAFIAFGIYMFFREKGQRLVDRAIAFVVPVIIAGAGALVCYGLAEFADEIFG